VRIIGVMISWYDMPVTWPTGFIAGSANATTSSIH